MKSLTRSLRLGLHLILSVIVANCSGSSLSSNSLTCGTASFSGPKPSNGSAANITTPLSVNGSDVNVTALTVGCGYNNDLCVSAKVCAPGSTTNCVTINNLLLDTGSYGLRVFSAALGSVVSSLTQVQVSSTNLGECVAYADGTHQWGPVKLADIQIGSLTASSVPMMVIDPSFGKRSVTNCSGTMDAQSGGYNGILGIGVEAQDCGSTCVGSAANGEYYICTGSSCSGSTVPLASQVTNPVTMLSAHNNGTIVQLTNVSDTGSSSAGGYLILGIDTAANNTSTGRTYFSVDTNGNFQTVWNSTTMSKSFIDSGSNALFMSTVSPLTLCVDGSGFYCPGNIDAFSATMKGSSGANATTVNFNVSDALFLVGQCSAPTAFNNLAVHSSSTTVFDWGLPFFFGRSVYTGIRGTSGHSLGTPPYWAF